MPHDVVISLCRTTGFRAAGPKRGSMRDGGPREPAAPGERTSSVQPGTKARHRRTDPGTAAMGGPAADPRTGVPADPLADPRLRSRDPRSDPRLGLRADAGTDPNMGPPADPRTNPRTGLPADA